MEPENKKILFYYLSAFRQTGGIEKFNRSFIKALNQLSASRFSTSIVSVYDKSIDDRYNGNSSFKGFDKKRAKSLVYIIRQAFKHDILVLGHINLAIAGLLVKLLNPRCKLFLVAHGIEIWDRMFYIKKACLRRADVILSVSNYTKNQLVLRNGIPPERIQVFPNTIDPFFKIPKQFHKPDYLLKRHGLTSNHNIIFTLSRLKNSEQYKGYDKVIAALPAILKEAPFTTYILGGKYDFEEKKRIDNLLELYKVSNNVILTGYIDDDEIPDYYRVADIFAMPSLKEGFGIVFLEALACGTRVIGGNQDGTVDALKNGSLGELINPTRTSEIATRIIKLLRDRSYEPMTLQSKVLAYYRFDLYLSRLNALMN